MAHDVFISYSAKDKSVADAVCATLEGMKIRCWIAPRDVLPGVPYAESLVDAIDGSRIVVLVFSSNSNRSPQVLREIERAVSKGVSIIPFRIEDAPLSKSMEFYISVPHWLDALTQPLEKHLKHLAETVRYLLSRSSEAEEEAVSTLGVPELETILSPDADGTYTVAWGSVAHTEEYIVEEDDSKAFSSPTKVYAGPELFVERTGVAQGRYWYRVKARNASGESVWSDAVSVEVVRKEEALPKIEAPRSSEGGSRETITVDLPGGAKMEMVWIEPGTFIMGSPEDEPGRMESEGPQHGVIITKGFWLGKYVITQEQWTAVMDTHPWMGKIYVRENPNHPAVNISWADVQAFIAKLNSAEGTEVYRLPTEAEWEYACRADTTTRWSFGDDKSRLGEYAWCYANAWDVGEHYAHAVGTKLPNPWGLHDMHGNVWEWCQDWYDENYYSESPKLDPTGANTGNYRVLRGGSWSGLAGNMRCAYRYVSDPANSGVSVGFRCVRSSP